MKFALKLRYAAPTLVGVVVLAGVAGPAVAGQASLRTADFAVVGDQHLRKSTFNKSLRQARKQGSSGKAARKAVATAQIQSAWYAGEVAALGIIITDKQVRDRFEPLKRQSFPRESDYTRFLKETGQTERDLLKLVRASMNREAVQERWGANITVTDDEVTAHYNQDPTRYGTPESRDVNLVFTTSRKQAGLARRALDKGQSFGKVAKKYSMDSVSRKHGGRFPGVVKEQFPPSLDRAVFSAQLGDLIGPIKTQFGYYVLKILRIRPAVQQTLAEVREEIVAYLKQEKFESASAAAAKDFRIRWRALTVCRAAYATKDCGRIER